MLQGIKNIYHLYVAILANIRYLFPARNLTVIGITGTDGKTTTTSLVYHVLKTAGKQVSLISTVSAIIGGKSYDTGFHVTNPSSFPLQKFLNMAGKIGRKRDKKYLVLEVTSHGIDQNRIWGIPFAVAGLTNITHEHLDYHKTYDNYVATKTKLLSLATIAVINKDDSSYKKVKKYLGTKHGVLTYGKEKADFMPQNFPFKSKLIGEYNVYNCLLAIAICKQLGIVDEDIKKGIETFTPPIGRTEIVYPTEDSRRSDFTIMIDFAHTPNAFEQLLSALRPGIKGRLIHVFGSAGQRDKTKRPLMGRASAKYADVIIMTSEDPRKEKVKNINAQIRSGIPDSRLSQIQLFDIPDRQEAILKAVSLAQKGDYIVITGKAHESTMNYGHGEMPWSDHEAVKKSLIVRL